MEISEDPVIFSKLVRSVEMFEFSKIYLTPSKLFNIINGIIHNM